MARKSRPSLPDLLRRLRGHRARPTVRSIARALFRSRLLLLFLALCLAGVLVGVLAPRENVAPEVALFHEMSVVSFRDSPEDTAAHFVVDLSAGGRPFRRYDLDAGTFTPPQRGRDYNRAITGTVYRPLEVRGHVAQGLWLDVPRAAQPLLPEQFDEVYRATLDFVKPVSFAASAVGMLSGYSIGYRLATWDRSLHSHAVQERLLATPGLGRSIAREAWRRVLLEPLVTGPEDDAHRFVATATMQRLYTNFFRLALDDSDAFIPREAERLAHLGHEADARAMLAFATSVRRAQAGSRVTSADCDAIERWASLLARRGHWAAGTIPPPGEERARYLGTLAWYGVAPSSPESNRIWVGPRVLVREGDLEGYVADDVPATEVGCPVAWRAELARTGTGGGAWAEAWLDEHAEFRALASLAASAGAAWNERAAAVAARAASSPAGASSRAASPVLAVPVANDRPVVVPVAAPRFDSTAARTAALPRDTVPPAAAPAADTLHASAPAESARADSTR